MHLLLCIYVCMRVHYYYNCKHAIYEVYGINQARAQRGPGTGEGGILYIYIIYMGSPLSRMSHPALGDDVKDFVAGIFSSMEPKIDISRPSDSF
jgi:hypothetical protein